MRKMKCKVWGAQKMQSQFEFPSGLEELTPDETKNIVAGEGISYWLGYAAAKIGQFFS